MKFAFLLTGLTGYNDAAFRALRERGNEVLVAYPSGQTNYEFEQSGFGPFDEVLRWSGAPDQQALDELLDRFEPDVVVMVSWGQREYRRVMRRLAGRALRVLISTNIWENKPRQWLGRATHRIYLDPLYDCVFVPGERSEWFARRLGFSGDRIIRGSNTADTRIFDRGPRDPQELATARAFLFTGRLMAYKGVDVLARAYSGYREGVAEPWDLHVAGVGELAPELAAIPGVTMHGFVSAPDLSDLMHRTSCLVLPSYIDFFGVVVHEAALSGQVLLCSDGVGAGPYLLQDGFNGWTVPVGDADRLREAMERVSSLTAEELVAMSTASRSLAGRFSPELWAAHVESECRSRLARLRR